LSKKQTKQTDVSTATTQNLFWNIKVCKERKQPIWN